MLCDLGVMPYGDALARQLSAHDAVSHGACPVIFTVQHPPVLTMGKNADAQNLLFSRDFYRQNGVDLFEVERGGEVTAHMPGQLVIYLVLPLAALGLSVRSYIYLLEEAVISTLVSYGIKACRDLDYPGVWVGHSKICAIGVRIKNRTSMHGLALNINNSMDLYGWIVPCGIRHRSVTNVQECLGREVEFQEVQSVMLSQISKIFGQRHNGNLRINPEALP